jgi:CBS domain-containing protein
MSRYGFDYYGARADQGGRSRHWSGYGYDRDHSSGYSSQPSSYGGWDTGYSESRGDLMGRYPGYYGAAGFGERGMGREGYGFSGRSGERSMSREGYGFTGRSGGVPDDLYGLPYDYGDLYDDARYGSMGYGMSGGGGYSGRQSGWSGRDDRGSGLSYGSRDLGQDDVFEEYGERYGLSGADRVRVDEIMTENPEAVTPDTTLTDAARRMKDLDVGILPVVDDETNRRLQGVITDRDLAVRALAEGKTGKAEVKSFMTREVETVTAGSTMRDVMDTMKRAQVRRVPVVDEQNRLVGIVAQADLAVEYAGLDFDQQVEVEEVVERISEPGRPRRREAFARARNRPTHQQTTYRYDRPFTDRLREMPHQLREMPDRVWSGADRLFHEGAERLREGTDWVRHEMEDGWRGLRRTARQWTGGRYDRGY